MKFSTTSHKGAGLSRRTELAQLQLLETTFGRVTPPTIKLQLKITDQFTSVMGLKMKTSAL